jgi:bacterioferritin-associated ferredoxin
MFVCVCRAVTEREVKVAIEAGATTVQAVTRACCAGDDCGACHGAIRDMIDEHGGCKAGVDDAVRLPVLRERAA